MITRYFHTFASLSIALSLPAIATAQSQDYDVRPEAARVTGAALTAAFKGVIHEGAYNFDANGRPGVRYTERHLANGRVAYAENDDMINGNWIITPNDTICYSYDSNEMGSGCFRIYKLGSCFYFYSDFWTAREDELDQDYWTARSVKKGERATCEDMIS